MIGKNKKVRGYLLTLWGAVTLTVISCKTEVGTVIAPLNTDFQGEDIAVASTFPQAECVDSSEIILLPKQAEDILWEEVVATYQYVPLETSPECLLGEINKIQSDDGCYFVFDKRNQILASFRHDGSFFRKYGSVGHGPGEYIQVSDFYLDREHQQLVALDLGGRKLVRYRYDGTMVDEQPLYYYYSQMETTANGQLALSTALAHNPMLPALDAWRLVLADTKQVPQRVAFSYPEEMRRNFHFETRSAFSKTSDGRLYYNHFLSNVIWEVGDTTCVGRYRLQFPEYAQLVDDKELSTLTDEDFSRIIRSARYFPSSFLMNRSFLLAYICEPSHEVSLLLYDRWHRHARLGRIVTADRQSLVTRLLVNHFDAAVDNDTFLSVIQPFHLFKVMKESERYDIPLTLGKQEKALVEHLTAEDNPVLLVVKMRPF
jgi:hypothetical protein